MRKSGEIKVLIFFSLRPSELCDLLIPFHSMVCTTFKFFSIISDGVWDANLFAILKIMLERVIAVCVIQTEFILIKICTHYDNAYK